VAVAPEIALPRLDVVLLDELQRVDAEFLHGQTENRDEGALKLLPPKTTYASGGVPVGADDGALQVPVLAAGHDLNLAATDRDLRLSGCRMVPGADQPGARNRGHGTVPFHAD